MARKTTITLDARQIARDSLRRGMAANKREAMRSGVIQRAQTIPDRRKAESRKACRGRFTEGGS